MAEWLATRQLREKLKILQNESEDLKQVAD